GAAELGRRFHFWIERLDMRGPAAEPQPDDRRVAGRLTLRRRLSAAAQQVGQEQTAHAQGADLEKVPSRRAIAVDLPALRPQLKHVTPLKDGDRAALSRKADERFRQECGWQQRAAWPKCPSRAYATFVPMSISKMK